MDAKYFDKLYLEAELKRSLTLLHIAKSLKDFIKNIKAELKKLELEENHLKSELQY